MDDIWELIQVLAEHAPLWIAICVAFLSGIVLNYLGVRYFTTVSNGALFATGAILAAVLATELLKKGGPESTWTESALLPLGIWAAGALLTYLDIKLHLSAILTFLMGAIATGGLVLLILIGVFSSAALSPAETILVLGIGLILTVIGGMIVLKVNASKPMLMLACALCGTVLIGYSLANLPVLLHPGAGETLPITALEVELFCLGFPTECLDMALQRGWTLQDLYPWLTLEVLAIPVTGIVVQWMVLIRYKRVGRMDRLSSAM